MDIALALGGGGVKGSAHIGVIDRLEALGFRIRAIAGTSAGGMVGASYAAGNSPLAILKAVQNLDGSAVYRRHPDDGPSILGYAGLMEGLSGLIGENTFASLKIPFACTAVDLNTASEIYLQDGKVLNAIMATMAVPGIFPPIQQGNLLLVDGGVLDPVPTCLARKLAPNLPIVAVVLSPEAADWQNKPHFSALKPPPLPIPVPAQILESFARMRFGQALQIFSKSLEISTLMMTELRLKIDRPDVILRPAVSNIGMFDSIDPLTLFEAGRMCVDEQIRNLRREVSWRGGIDRLFRSVQPIGEPQVLQQENGASLHKPTKGEE